MAGVKVANGKYEVLHENGAGLRALRYGEPWRDLAGDGLVLALVQEIEELKADAERYRWLCNGNGYFLEEEQLCGHGNNKDLADAAIDAERLK